MPNPPLIAVDTNVLLDRAAGNETVLDCFSTLHRKLPKSPIFILPTVIIELAGILETGSDGSKVLALKALQSIIKPWGLVPLNCLPVGNEIVEETGRRIRAAGLLPMEEVHDSFIIAEAALANVKILVSSDTHIRDIDQSALQELLDKCDLEKTLIASPWRIVNSFFNSVH